jgi:hypothetical protein
MSKKDSIKLSPKYGVNPCIPACFYCGKDKNEILLLGKIGKRGEDIEAPKHTVFDYEPCDECKKLIGENILVIGVEQQTENNLLPIRDDLVPTGSWCVMTEKAVNRIFDLDDDTSQAVSEHKRLLVNGEILSNLIAQDNKLKEDGVLEDD